MGPMARFRPVILGFSITLACACPGQAQPVNSSLDELGNLRQTGSTVTVTDASGREYRGTVADVSPTLLSVQAGRAIRRFAVADVRSVRVREDDALLNGALVGAAVGAGATSLLFLDNECRNDGACYGAVAAYAGIGALVGLGVDALLHREVVVYAAPTGGAGPVMRPMPVLAGGQKGIRLLFEF
jgi:hypothetical protein